MSEDNDEFEPKPQTNDEKIDDTPCDSKGQSKMEIYALTAIMFYTQLTYGIVATAVSPAMVDLKYVLNEDMNKVSIYLTVNSIGYVCGSLFGIVFKYINRQMTLIVTGAIMGVCFAIIPLSSSIIIYYVLAFVVGLCCGAWDCGQTVWLIEMWREKSGPFLQLSQFGYGIGTILGPLIDKPYVTGEPEEDSESTTMMSSTTMVTTMITTMVPTDTPIDRRSFLMKPFVISGSLQLGSAVIMGVMMLFKRYKHTSNEVNTYDQTEDVYTISTPSSSNSRNKLSDEKGSPTVSLICLGALCLASSNCIEMAYFQFSSTMSQHLSLHLTASDAAVIMSAMTTAYTVGRGLAIIAAIKIHPQTMLIVNYLLLIAAHVMLLFARKSIILLWTANIVVGLGFSSVWPTVFSFIEQYVEINDRVGTVYIFSVGLVQALSPLVLGHLIEKKPISLVYFDFSCLTVTIITYVIIRIIIRLYRKSLETNEYKPNLYPRMSIGSIHAAKSFKNVRRSSMRPSISYTSSYYYDDRSTEKY